ncbi:MAG: hypothetical protein ACI4GZ_05385 [Ruminococcus sp.]
MEERTIKALSNYPTAKVYVRFSCDKLCREFCKQAEAEGYRFGTIKPTESSPSDLIAVLDDCKLAFGGFAGHMAYHHREAVVGGLTCIDYEKYIAGDDDFIV